MAALDSFVSLSASVPEWIERLESVARQVADRHAEFSRLSRNEALNGFNPLRKSRTGSNESLRPDDSAEPPSALPPLTADSRPVVTTDTSSRPIVTPESTDALPPPPQATRAVAVDPGSRRLFQGFREQAAARRKRKSASIASQGTGPPRLRSRLSLIVYYDSAVQEGFELLVRRVAAARNQLRKARTAANAAARLASLGMEESPFAGARTDHGVFHQAKRPRLPRGDGPFEVTADDPVMAAFETLDKDLEAAQSLCEVGAHQFLRDGTCAEEISGSMERFENCIRVAQEQAERLRKMDDRDADEDRSARKAQESVSGEPETAVADAGGQPQQLATGIQIDDSIAIPVDDSHRFDDAHTKENQVNNEDAGLLEVDAAVGEVNSPLKIDRGITVDTAPIKKSPTVDATDIGIEVDPLLKVDDAIAIDDQHDSEAFQIDLTAFRRTRGR